MIGPCNPSFGVVNGDAVDFGVDWGLGEAVVTGFEVVLIGLVTAGLVAVLVGLLVQTGAAPFKFGEQVDMNLHLTAATSDWKPFLRSYKRLDELLPVNFRRSSKKLPVNFV